MKFYIYDSEMGELITLKAISAKSAARNYTVNYCFPKDHKWTEKELELEVERTIDRVVVFPENSLVELETEI